MLKQGEDYQWRAYVVVYAYLIKMFIALGKKSHRWQ